MAAVIGFTKERMLEIENTCITSGAVVLDDLILTQRDGTQINAGNVRGPQGTQGIAATIESASASGLASGAAPTVALGGTPQQRTFAFGIPKGDKGDKGDQGIQGIQGADGAQGSAASPAGTIALWGSDIAPANWLICDGSAVSRTTYASLYAIIGTKYGAGDGVSTFNLPNLKGQTPIGKDAAQTEFAALNQKGGEKAHLLTAAESGLPAHNHTQQAHNHIQDGHFHNVGASGAGSGTPDVWMNQEIAQSTWAGWAFNVDGVNGGARRLVAGTVAATNQAATSLNNANAAANAASAHNTLQPYTVVNFIIKFTNGDTPGDSQLTQRVSAMETTRTQTIVDRARWQRLLTGGGMRKVFAGGVSWQERFIVLGAQTADMPSGYMEIWMPPNGTVIPVHGDTTTPTQTVANGIVPMKDWYSLYYEFVPGATYVQDYSKFHLVSHLNAQAAGFVIPNNWVFLCIKQADGYSPFYTWGDGRSQDNWRAMALLNGWVAYSSTVWEQPAWKYLDNGDIEIKGLIANGGGTANISSFLVQYAPLERKIFHVACSAGMWRVDMDSTGSLISNGAQTAGATNAFVSLAGIHWTPQG